MCGIVGYIGRQDALPILFAGLHRLEYRGYDSAGVAVITRSGLKVHKAAGKVRQVEATLPRRLKGTVGIAHTRWATHGEPNDDNAHPHFDCTGRIAVVHNGIIENAAALRAELEAKGHFFASETDTEVLAHLIDAVRRRPSTDALRQVLTVIAGTYGWPHSMRDIRPHRCGAQWQAGCYRHRRRGDVCRLRSRSHGRHTSRSFTSTTARSRSSRPTGSRHRRLTVGHRKSATVIDGGTGSYRQRRSPTSCSRRSSSSPDAVRTYPEWPDGTAVSNRASWRARVKRERPARYQAGQDPRLWFGIYAGHGGASDRAIGTRCPPRLRRRPNFATATP